MHGYHIRIVLHPTHTSSTKNSHPAFNSTCLFIPTSLFQHLPSQTPAHTARRNAPFNPKNKDYRYGPIRLDWVDFENMGTTAVNGKERDNGRGGADDLSYTKHFLILSQTLQWPLLCTIHVPSLGPQIYLKAPFMFIVNQNALPSTR